MAARAELVERVVARLRQGPAHFLDVLEALEGVEYREVLRAWGAVRETTALRRDEQGRYLVLMEAPEGTGQGP